MGTFQLVDKLDIDQLKTVEKIKKEIERFQKFNYILGNESKLENKNNNINIKNYVSYILLNGAKEEKRELLECLKDKIYLRNKNIFLR